MAGVPADFRVPRTWPTPTDKWVRENALWIPSPDWTPAPGADAAPIDWRFWVPNKLWSQTIGNNFRSIAVWGRIANWLALVWVVALIAGPFLGYPPVIRMIGISAALVSFACLVVHETLKARKTKRLLLEFAIIAHHGRHDRLTREYQRYLTAVA